MPCAAFYEQYSEHLSSLNLNLLFRKAVVIPNLHRVWFLPNILLPATHFRR